MQFTQSIRLRGLGTYLAFSFSVVSVLLTVILLGVIDVTVTQQIRRDIGSNLAQLASHMSARLDQSMFERYREVQLMAERISTSDRPGSASVVSQRELEALQRTYPYYAWIGVTNDVGTVLTSTKRILSNADVSKRPWFINALKGVFVGDVHEAKLLAALLPNAGKEPLRFVDVAFPYRRTDGATGVLGAHLSWEWVKEVRRAIVEAVPLRREVDALILSMGNSVLLGPPELQGVTLNLPSLNTNAEGNNGSSLERWPDGQQYLVGFSAAKGYGDYPGLGWKVLVREKSELAYQPVKQLQAQVFWTGLSVAVLFSLLGLWLSRLITRPLAELSNSAKRIEAGLPADIEPVGAVYQEVTALGNSLKSLVQNLQEKERSVREAHNSLEQTFVMLESSNTALQHSETRMRGILQSAMDAIISVDDGHNIILFNAAASTMFGCRAEDAIGSSLTRFIPTRFHKQHTDFLKKLEHTDPQGSAVGLSGVTVGLRLGGEEFPAEISFSSVVESGNWLHTLFIRDVTSRVKAYKALERSNLDLQQFAYVASHDLKTPLRSIGGFVQILERNYGEKLDDNARALIRRTANAAKQLEQLTEDLLSYARIEAEAKQFASVNMTEVAQEVIHLLDAAITSTGAVVTVDDLPTVWGDRTQLVQLLLNLLGNALKYCRDRAPLIQVSARQGRTAWVLSVTDNGIGIGAEHLGKVFEVFKRLHTPSEFPGTGIGLAVCRRVLDGHGGKIWATSQPGRGSVFSFTLPVRLVGASHEN